MRAALGPVLFVAACRFSSPSLGGGDDGVPGDAPPDVGFDGPVECFGTGLGVNVCLAMPTMPLMLGGPNTTIDTDHSMLCQPANPTTYCVLAGTTVTIDTHLSAFGSRPLVIVAETTLTTKGGAVIDVASHHNQRGPGANPSSVCLIGSDPDPNRGGGGRGGSFGGA